MVFVSSFHPRGGVFCCSWRDGAFFFFFPRRDGAVVVVFPRRDGAVVFFFRGGTGWLFFFRRDGTGRCFFFFRGPGRDGCFWRWQFFWRDGAKSLHRPAKGGLNRPASRPCKALVFHIATPEGTHHAAFLNILSAARELLLVATLLPAKARQLSTRARQAAWTSRKTTAKLRATPASPDRKKGQFASVIVQPARNSCRITCLSTQYDISSMYDVGNQARRYHFADAGGAYPRIMECSMTNILWLLCTATSCMQTVLHYFYFILVIITQQAEGYSGVDMCKGYMYRRCDCLSACWDQIPLQLRPKDKCPETGKVRSTNGTSPA